MTGRIEIAEQDFASIVPFGFAVDSDGVVTTVGNALARRLATDVDPRLVDETFRVLRPSDSPAFTALHADPRKIVVLEAVDGLFLKGSKIELAGGRTAFVGSPVVSDLDEFLKCGLTLTDFAPSDATPDLLISMQATRSALDDGRRLSDELRIALANAEAATEAKARFLAVMSHEIRTPLNGFGAMIDLLRGSDLSSEQLEHVETMDRCAHSLLSLVNDILDFSKLEAGKVEITRRPIHLSEAIGEISHYFYPVAKEFGVEISVETELGELDWARADYERIRQVLSNLLGNAIKFTQDGWIHVSALTAGVDTVVVDVQDSGIGIPEEVRERLFGAFVQGDTSSTRQFGGTGLGLTISRQLARAMGGDVELIRTGPEGTQFRFTFVATPCAPDAVDEPVPAAPKERPETLTGIKVLVAEDDATNRFVAQKLLNKLGAEATFVEDGHAAVHEALSNTHDVILMDLMMPKLGGVEATRRIRAADGPCRDVPIIAFSAATRESDQLEAIKAGMTDFIEKPTRLDALREMLHKHVESPDA